MKSIGAFLLPPVLHERFQIERYHVHSFIRKKAMPLMRAGMKVLDAGSGKLEEQYLREELLATGITLHTCDLNVGPGVDFSEDVCNLSFADETYDMVLCTQVLEHVKDPARVCRELARVVKPGGSVFLTTPQSSPLHNLPWNFFNFTNLGLELLFEQAGLEVLEEEPQGGHYCLLAFELHWTVHQLRRTPMPGILKKPLVLVSQLMFGFLFKGILIWLDRFDPKPLNTMGWNFHGRKPLASPGRD